MTPIRRALAGAAASASIGAPALAEVQIFEDAVFDTSRNRLIPYRVYYDDQAGGPLPVILVSHGGAGSLTGYQRAEHLGSTYAAHSYLAIHIGHLASGPGASQLTDRPADVTFVLDRLTDGFFPLPLDAGATPDLERIGHIGHSYGAYTAHAVAGATFTHGTYRDERIDAIAGLSPQGDSQFGAFDFGVEENTWRPITIPVYTLIGELELDANALGAFRGEDWRLQPFQRSTITTPKYTTILPGAGHSTLWSSGTPEEDAYIAQSTRVFFDIHLRGEPIPPREIGAQLAYPGLEHRVKSADVDGSGVIDVDDLDLYLGRLDRGADSAEVSGDRPVRTPDSFDAATLFEAIAASRPGPPA
ncbi:MAG: hypothetical protein AAGI30_07630 [Planctomycetota bacterium]